MNRPHNILKSRSWIMTLLLTAFVAGCGDRTASTVTTASPAIVATSANTGLAGLGKGPVPVLLGTAGDYVILAKSAISTAGGSTVAGNLGVSPAVASHISEFSLLAAPIQFSISPQVYGHIFAADYAVQTPAKLAAAIVEMQTAYADAAGRKPDFTELGAGIIGGMTLAPATYKWSTAVLIPTSITLSGGPDDVWIFQVAQGVIQASAARVILIGGARAKNIFWQVAGAVEVGSAAHTEGVILSQSSITLGTGASATSRLLAQSTVSLDANAVTQPAP
jgi:Ice-binding-like